jgi:putative holliday junction resolvase
MTQNNATVERFRILALDPGKARIGVAVSDELGMFAHPRPAVVERTREAAIARIARMVRDLGVSEVVVGLPLTLAGARGAQAGETRAFVEALRFQVSVPVREIDERLSSAQAERLLPGAGKKRDGSLDSAAAAVVLQSVLDSRRQQGAR